LPNSNNENLHNKNKKRRVTDFFTSNRETLGTKVIKINDNETKIIKVPHEIQIQMLSTFNSTQENLSKAENSLPFDFKSNREDGPLEKQNLENKSSLLFEI